MANLVAADITVAFIQKRRVEGRSHNLVSLTFGDGVKTYGAGGVPISGGALGCPNVVESVSIIGAGTSGYSWSFDRVNQKLVAIQGTAAHTHDLLLKNAAVADGTTTRVNAGANLLGANTGGDLTVTGSGANGGVVAVAGQVGAQPSTVAIASQVLQCEVIGW